MFKILIVEDDTELCRLFSHVLEKNGYHTRMVSNGQEALDALAEEYVDLIISDIMMPVMDGYELVRSLRKKERHDARADDYGARRFRRHASRLPLRHG